MGLAVARFPLSDALLGALACSSCRPLIRDDARSAPARIRRTRIVRAERIDPVSMLGVEK
jgi:hypothetical protein